MKEEPDSLSVPYNFARCFNAQCPQAPKCLRHIATQLDTSGTLSCGWESVRMFQDCCQSSCGMGTKTVA